MNKSLTKKALKEKLKTEKTKNLSLVSRVSELEAEVDSLGKKLDALGSDIDTPEADTGCLRVIKVEPKCYGLYHEYCDHRTLESQYYEIIRDLIDELIKSHVVQFIRNNSPFYPYETITAKLFVIPWNDIALSKKFMLHKNNLKRVGDT